MNVTGKRVLTLALAGTLAGGAIVWGQEPNFNDLPDNTGETQLLSAVRELSRRVQDLESRLNACEVRNSSAARAPRGASAMTATANDALERVVADAKGLRDKIETSQAGDSFPDPGDRRIVYWRVKNPKDWPTITGNIKRFVSFMEAVLPRAGELTETSTKAYADLVTWGRGRILYYRRGLSMDQQAVLAFDFGPAIVPVPPDPNQGRR